MLTEMHTLTTREADLENTLIIFVNKVAQCVSSSLDVTHVLSFAVRGGRKRLFTSGFMT